MSVYYHYTTPQAAEEIRRTGVIKKSSKKAKRRDAVYGDGVYLTQMNPTASRQWIALNNYDGMTQNVNAAISSGEHCSVFYAKLVK